jgi:hypothetical protein
MVLPSISPLSDNGAGAGVVDVPPPLKFKPLSGRPRHISVGAARAQMQIHPSMSVAKVNGIRYEWQVYSQLREWFDPIHIQHCLHFEDDKGYRTIIPDAFVVLQDAIFLFEVKSQHMPETWWQCAKLYKPVLEGLYEKPVFCVEIVKKFDPQMPFPVEVVMIEDLKSYVLLTRTLGDDQDSWPPQWGVFKWKKT